MKIKSLHLTEESRTKLYPRALLLAEQLDQKIRDLIIKWMVLSFGGEFTIEKFNGKRIYYKGVLFNGSPEIVFWGGWATEYLNSGSIDILHKISESAFKSNYDIHRCVDEAVELLCIASDRIYDTMVDVDRKLNGDGRRFGEPKDVSRHKEKFREFIQSHAHIFIDEFEAKQYSELNKKNRPLLEVKPGIAGVRIDMIEIWKRLIYWHKNKP